VALCAAMPEQAASVGPPDPSGTG